jgi:hypothetical protein
MVDSAMLEVWNDGALLAARVAAAFLFLQAARALRLHFKGSGDVRPILEEVRRMAEKLEDSGAINLKRAG